MIPQISIVVPLYNESISFPHLIGRLNEVISKSEILIEVVLVNDGSQDNTAELIQQVAFLNSNYMAVLLARNYGHQIALSAGLSVARGSEAVFVIDGDLQDPPELLWDFYNKFKEGYDVVYAIRKERKESAFKKWCYFLFYRIQRSIVNVDIPLDSGDFSLMSRRVVDIMNKMPEESRFIRGMRTWIGLKQVGIEYERDARVAGESKYSFTMLIKLAYNGIFNFSEFPIKFITKIGAISIIASLVFLVTVLFKKFVFGTVPEGYTSLLIAIIMFNGVLLISLGIIGEYVLRIFFQVKGRPLFVIKRQVVNQKVTDNTF
jgi:glycosyltransferase involved in cell wall biosynthesis